MNLFLKRISIVAILIITATTSTLGQTQLPKGAKLKTIEYKSVDYLAVGYIEKNLFVENQTLTFFSKETQDTIISGKYYTKNNISYIDGFWKQPTEKGITRANGIFKIANNDVNGLTTKSKEAKILSVTIEDISYYQGFRNKYPARLEKQRNGEYFLTVKYTDRNGDNDLVKLELKVDKSLINQYGFLAIDDFIFYTTSVVMTQGNGTTFTGKVENTKDENNEVSYKYKEGKWQSTNGEREEITLLPNKDFTYKRIFLKKDNENNVVEIELNISQAQMDKYGFWATTDYFDNISQVKYTYKNGNIYAGEIDLEKKLLTNGRYIYVSGEVFEGNFGGNWLCGIPIDGKMTFNSNDIEEGNWLKEYQITKDEAKELEAINSPRSVRKKAMNFFYERNYKNAIENAQYAIQNEDYKLAKDWYAKAETFISRDELLALPEDKGNDFQNFMRRKDNPTKKEYIEDEIARIDKLIEDQEFKTQMISKYGQKFGIAIYNGEFVIGMTKKMVDEIMAEEIFTKSITTTRNNKLESWSYRQEQNYLVSKGTELQRKGEGICKRYGDKSNECASAAQRMIHLSATMLRYSQRIQQYGGPQIPRTLFFTNDKLTDIYP